MHPISQRFHATPQTVVAPDEHSAAGSGSGGIFTLRLDPHGWTAEAPADLTLVEAAAFAGIELPTSCRNGTCRACLCHMPKGAVHYQIPWPGVSADEKREGWVLPCVAHAAADVVLVVPRAQRVLPRSENTR